MCDAERNAMQAGLRKDPRYVNPARLRVLFFSGEINRRRGNELYRRFRVYLWGSAYAVLNRGMQACRVFQQRT
jgi:hypothetical protein